MAVVRTRAVFGKKTPSKKAAPPKKGGLPSFGAKPQVRNESGVRDVCVGVGERGKKYGAGEGDFAR